MKRITFTAGTGQNARGEAIAPETLTQALATIRADLAHTFGGYTELPGMGGWINGAGELITEPCVRFVALATAGTVDPLAVAERIRVALWQESVLVEVEDSHVTFATHAAAMEART